MDANIKILTTKSLHVISKSCIGKHQMPQAFNELMLWSRKKGFLANPNFKMGTLFYDSFKTTPAHKVRMKAFVLLENSIPEEDNLEHLVIPSQKCISARFEIGMEEFEKTWISMFAFMNEKELSRSTHPPFEIYHNNFNDHPKKKCKVSMYIPIQ